MNLEMLMWFLWMSLNTSTIVAVSRSSAFAFDAILYYNYIIFIGVGGVSREPSEPSEWRRSKQEIQ